MAENPELEIKIALSEQDFTIEYDGPPSKICLIKDEALFAVYTV